MKKTYFNSPFLSEIALTISTHPFYYNKRKREMIAEI